MKQGMTLTELATEVERQTSTKRDFVADTRKMEVFSEVGKPSELILHSDDGAFDFQITPHCHRQISQRLKIPAQYYDRMLADYPALLDTNINTLFAASPERRMVRTLDNGARAFLSERFRPMDNFDLAEAVLPILMEQPDMRVESAALTETKMYIKALFPRTEMEVAKGDVVQSGLVISNSEVGNGSLRVEPLIYRLVCLNGMIAPTSTKKYHVGRAADADAFEIFSDETRKQSDKALWMQVRDTVRSALSDAVFQEVVAKMQDAMGLKIEAPIQKVVERAANKYQLSEGEGQSVLKHLIEGGDLSGYGLMNALTRASQEVDSYERATHMERVGGQVIELSPNDWTQLAEAA